MKTWKNKFLDKEKQYNDLTKRIQRLNTFYKKEADLNRISNFITLILPELKEGLLIINKIELDYRTQNTNSQDKSVIEIISEELILKLGNLYEKN